jgi:hypothetical protein
MTLKEKLTALRKLFSDKRHWTQVAYFRKPGQIGSYMQKYARGKRTCYCLAGGLNKVTGRDLRAETVFSEIRALGFEDSSELFDWNDDPKRTINEVRTRIDEALNQLTKKNKQFSV